MYKVGINFDEISDDLDIAIKTMKECDVRYGELRTVNQKNFVFWSDDEVVAFKQKIDEAGIELIAAATPLFKWYVNAGDPDVEHDSFGFNPRLGDEDKRKVIERAVQIADMLSIPRLRIFSGLGYAEGAGASFAADPLLGFALELAEKYGIDLYLENEPVCRVHDKEQVIELFKNQPNPRLKFWLDIANLVELDEVIDEDFVSEVAGRLGYIHVKDFIIDTNGRRYMPVGQGQIDYTAILDLLGKLGPDDLIFTVETHAKTDKIGASVASIKATKGLVAGLGKN